MLQCLFGGKFGIRGSGFDFDLPVLIEFSIANSKWCITKTHSQISSTHFSIANSTFSIAKTFFQII